jgi:integrase
MAQKPLIGCNRSGATKRTFRPGSGISSWVSLERFSYVSRQSRAVVPLRNSYYVTVNGAQHNLRTADRSEAINRWHALMTKAPAPPEAPDATAVVLFAAFLEWAQKHKKPATYDWHCNYLHSFIKTIPPDLRIAGLKPFHVTRWLDTRDGWGPSSRRGAITTAKRAFTWAIEEGYIDHSPIAKIRKPKRRRRETILTDGQRQLIIEEASDESFRDLVTLIQETGVRPQEVRTVAARHVDLKNGLWIFPPEEHKTGEKTEQPRIVYLNGTALAITARLVETHPTGPICRNAHGKPWTRNAIRLRFRRLRRRLKDKLPATLCAYAFRHTFATTALERGLDAITVAELMGNKDVSMLSQVYQHLRQRGDHMKAAAERATSQNASSPVPT